MQRGRRRSGERPLFSLSSNNENDGPSHGHARGRTCIRSNYRPINRSILPSCQRTKYFRQPRQQHRNNRGKLEAFHRPNLQFLNDLLVVLAITGILVVTIGNVGFVIVARSGMRPVTVVHGCPSNLASAVADVSAKSADSLHHQQCRQAQQG